MKDDTVPDTQEIRGVLLPVGERPLLLPNAAVAEVIGFLEPEPQSEIPDWLLGRIEWRGRHVPVVSWERMVEGREPDWNAQRVRIAVLNTLNGNPDLPHIGILSVGLARLVRIHANALTEDPLGEDTSPLVSAAVVIADSTAWIPDLDELERQVTATFETHHAG